MPSGAAPGAAAVFSMVGWNVCTAGRRVAAAVSSRGGGAWPQPTDAATTIATTGSAPARWRLDALTHRGTAVMSLSSSLFML
jgi:hypothetical protein